jgi:peptidoglycan/LPS O-acetylase OafA/YrhL
MAIVIPLPVLPLLLAVLFPILVVSTVTCPESALNTFLETPPLRWVGRLSYSLYVWQTLFLQTTESPDPGWLTQLKWWPLNVFMITICSILSHYLIERPMIRTGRVVARRFASMQAHAEVRTKTRLTPENLVGVL